MLPFDWIRRTLEPEVCTSCTFIYEDMASQSGESLPIIYQPFDTKRRDHWRDRGALFDFLFSTGGTDASLLDFGPGDGWPSLIVAPYARHVTGVDASTRRARVCTENATRLGLANVDFVAVESRTLLPFADATFDGLLAASSIEQSPSPEDTLAELFRVLRPGGRMRVTYEALGRYRGDREQDTWLYPMNGGQCRLILYDRRVAEEVVIQYSLTYALSAAQLRAHFSSDAGQIARADVTVDHLQSSAPFLIDARVHHRPSIGPHLDQPVTSGRLSPGASYAQWGKGGGTTVRCATVRATSTDLARSGPLSETTDRRQRAVVCTGSRRSAADCNQVVSVKGSFIGPSVE